MQSDPQTLERHGNILIADDEATFRESTADLLRLEGYDCTCVGTGEDAFVALNMTAFDLLIADIRMPGNERLELLDKVAEMQNDLPILIVTAYPSAETAMESIHRSVLDYFAKPIEFREFLPKVEQAIAWSKARRITRLLKNQLANWQNEILSFEGGLGNYRMANSVEALDNLTKLAHGRLSGVAREVRLAGGSLDGNTLKLSVCKELGCQHMNILLQAIRDTVVVLERTKTAFKSKELGDLRTSLQQLLTSFAEAGIISPKGL